MRSGRCWSGFGRVCYPRLRMVRRRVKIIQGILIQRVWWKIHRLHTNINAVSGNRRGIMQWERPSHVRVLGHIHASFHLDPVSVLGGLSARTQVFDLHRHGTDYLNDTEWAVELALQFSGRTWRRRDLYIHSLSQLDILEFVSFLGPLLKFLVMLQVGLTSQEICLVVFSPSALYLSKSVEWTDKAGVKVSMNILGSLCFRRK